MDQHPTSLRKKHGLARNFNFSTVMTTEMTWTLLNLDELKDPSGREGHLWDGTAWTANGSISIPHNT